MTLSFDINNKGFLFQDMKKKIILFGTAFACTAVILGAMGAHGVKALIHPEQLETYETAVRYQLYHAFALLFLAAFAEKLHAKYIKYSFISFVLGIFFFSGSLYLLSLRTILAIENYKWLGPITPFGGLCFMIGWVSFFVAALNPSDK